MKLHELGASRPTEQIAKVFESHMGARVDFDRLTKNQARSMLGRVRGLIREHRSSPSIHFSERNPDYIKLVMMEQGLISRLREQDAAAAVPGMPAVDPAKQAAMATAQQQQRKRQIQDAIRAKQKEIQDLQKQMNMPIATAGVAESRRRISEGEVQQAQVVMAAQDMVDQMQKILEQVSAMQFKDLPALTDAIKNDTGVEQATQFQADATAALTQLLTAVQTTKTQLEAAQGVLTGQAPIVPGADQGGEMAGDMGLPPEGDQEADLGLDANLPDEDEEETPAATLGRERR